MSDKKPEEKPAFAKATAGEEEIQKKLEECEKKAAEYLAGWQRTRADFMNYKKEEMERIGELLKYASEEFVLKVLPILDNFEIIEKKMPDNLKNDENVRGLLLVKKQIYDFLKLQGVEELKTIGEKFDANFHEVVGEIPASADSASVATSAKGAATAGKEIKDKEKGIIVEEIQKGYKINGRLLRPAKVRVTK